jgi:hypothetical protein
MISLSTFGFPGRTTEYLPAIAVEKIMLETDPAMIAVRDIALKTLDENESGSCNKN